MLLATFILLLSVTSVYAEGDGYRGPYINLGLGGFQADISDNWFTNNEDSASVLKVAGGYVLNNIIALEIGHEPMGKVQETVFNRENTTDVNKYTISAGYGMVSSGRLLRLLGLILQ